MVDREDYKKAYQGGEVVDDLTGSEYEGSTPSDWAQRIILDYGWVDGAHHKQWVLDQVLRVLNGTPVIVKRHTWGPPVDRVEYRYHLGEPSEAYLAVCEEFEIDHEDPDYIGIPP